MRDENGSIARRARRKYLQKFDVREASIKPTLAELPIADAVLCAEYSVWSVFYGEVNEEN
jgi:hypothetical protein